MRVVVKTKTSLDDKTIVKKPTAKYTALIKIVSMNHHPIVYITLCVVVS